MELTINEQIQDDARIVVMWKDIYDFELLIVRLSLAYKKYRAAFGYPADYFMDTTNYQKTLWNTGTPKVFELLVNNMGWEYILELDKEVFEERRNSSGLYGSDLNIYQEFLYGNIGKSFKISDERNTFELGIGLKFKMPVNFKKIAYKASEAWKRFINIAPVPNMNERPLMSMYDANFRPTSEIAALNNNWIMLDLKNTSWNIDLNRYSNYMYSTGTTPTELFYDYIIDNFLYMELSVRIHLTNQRGSQALQQFTIMPKAELHDTGRIHPFRLMTFMP